MCPYIQRLPRLTETDLRALTLGVYHIKQATTYTLEHISADGSYSISIHKESSKSADGCCAQVAAVLWYIGC